MKMNFIKKKSVVEEEITIASKIRILPIKTDTNEGIVSCSSSIGGVIWQVFKQVVIMVGI